MVRQAIFTDFEKSKSGRFTVRKAATERHEPCKAECRANFDGLHRDFGLSRVFVSERIGEMSQLLHVAKVTNGMFNDVSDKVSRVDGGVTPARQIEIEKYQYRTIDEDLCRVKIAVDSG